MKSVVQAGWLMTVAFGNLIVVIVAESRVIKEQVGDAAQQKFQKILSAKYKDIWLWNIFVGLTEIIDNPVVRIIEKCRTSIHNLQWGVIKIIRKKISAIRDSLFTIYIF